MSSFSRLALASLVAAPLLACCESSSTATSIDGGEAARGAASEPHAELPDAAPNDSARPATDAAPGAAIEADGGMLRLSETGLYADVRTAALADGVRPFTPQGALWSDGADKRRFVYLPPGAQIDSHEVDAWILPVGTKLWKEFSVAGVRVETRLLAKIGDGAWIQVSYQWNEEQTDARAVPDGVTNAAGTGHDIPARSDCARCHDGVADGAIGFSAIQLAHAGEGVTLDALFQEGRLTQPAPPLRVPGTANERAALLYLHANCGNCHNDRTFISNVTDVDYTLRHDQLGAVALTNAYRTVQRDLRKSGGVDATNLVRRMSFRGAQGQMPPLASKQVDVEGVVIVREWLNQLLDASDFGIVKSPDAGTQDSGAD